MKKVPISISCAIRPSSPCSLNTMEMFIKLEVTCTENSTIPILDETSHHHIQIIGPLTPRAAPAVGRFPPGAPYVESSKAGKRDEEDVAGQNKPRQPKLPAQCLAHGGWPTHQLLLQLSRDVCQPHERSHRSINSGHTLIKNLAWSPVQKSGKAVSCLICVTKATPSLLWV